VRYRRSAHVVAYWRRDVLLLKNYATGRVAGGSALVCRLLDICSDWRTEEEIARELSLDRSPLLTSLLRQLVACTLLHRSDARNDPREQSMASLDPWNPEAGLFHTSTKDVHFWSAAEARRFARIRARQTLPPRPVTRYRGRPLVDLPRPVSEGEFARVVHARRTWRRFSTHAVTMEELSTVIGLSTGVQKWILAARQRMPLKTSPSGGARHPIECYVVVREVKGLRPGVYHYAADRHALERLRGPVSKGRLREYLPRSEYFARASALFFLTAVFERQLWRYPYSRAYRAALIEAGHVCQTMLLTATWLGLAPFSVMGLADSVIEADLGIDGIQESVLYAAGVGRRPARATWAPLPKGTLQIRPNRRLG